jgi:Fic family protein
MERLILVYGGEMQKLHVVERAALFHLRFETVHPFIDGNGRVGRLRLNLELMKEGYTPVNVKFTDRIKYYDCFSHYRENNNNDSPMTRLVEGYAMDELRRYIDNAEQSDTLISSHPEDFCTKNENGQEP